MTYERELQLAQEMLRECGRAALEYWRKGIAAQTKADESPVTEADRACEGILTRELTAAFPGDGLLGEEGANRQSRTGRRWILDPIDGTREFVRGSRFWAQLLALETDGEVALGVAHFPALDETYWAVRGQGAFRNGERIRVSAKSQVSEAVLCINSIQRLSCSPHFEGILNWLAPFWAVRSMGGCTDAMLVAAGHADAWIESTAEPWDLAALQVITEESGGIFANFGGGRSIHAGNCYTCAPGLEAAMRGFLRTRPGRD